MAFSSFSEFLFMSSIDSWRVSRSRYLSFGNRKKSQGAKYGAYGSWVMTFVLCLAKNSVTIRLEIQTFQYESGSDALLAQNMNHNVLSRSLMPTRWFSSTIFFTFSMLSSLTEVDGRLAWGKFSTTSRPSLNALCHSNTCVLYKVDSRKHFCNIFNDSVAVIPLETHNFKQIRCSILFP